MDKLTELLMYRALHFKQSNQSTTDVMIDHFVHDNELRLGQLEMKNVCAKVSVELADRLDEVCGVLSISKRRFIESAIINALDEADRVMTELNIFEAVDGPAAEGK